MEIRSYNSNAITKLHNRSKDHLGSIRITVDQNNEITNGQDYLPLGSIFREYNIASTNEKYDFTEKERDTETGLNYFGARYYDSDLGRWTSVDPLADMYPGSSPYNYAGNNPLCNIDPNGMSVVGKTDSNGVVSWEFIDDNDATEYLYDVNGEIIHEINLLDNLDRAQEWYSVGEKNEFLPNQLHSILLGGSNKEVGEYAAQFLDLYIGLWSGPGLVKGINYLDDAANVFKSFNKIGWNQFQKILKTNPTKASKAYWNSKSAVFNGTRKGYEAVQGLTPIPRANQYQLGAAILYKLYHDWFE